MENREGQKGKYFMPQLYGAGVDKKMVGSIEAEQTTIKLKE